jgi:hypothetical protein
MPSSTMPSQGVPCRYTPTHMRKLSNCTSFRLGNAILYYMDILVVNDAIASFPWAGGVALSCLSTKVPGRSRRRGRSAPKRDLGVAGTTGRSLRCLYIVVRCPLFDSVVQFNLLATDRERYHGRAITSYAPRIFSDRRTDRCNGHAGELFARGADKLEPLAHFGRYGTKAGGKDKPQKARPSGASRHMIPPGSTRISEEAEFHEQNVAGLSPGGDRRPASSLPRTCDGFRRRLVAYRVPDRRKLCGCARRVRFGRLPDDTSPPIRSTRPSLTTHFKSTNFLVTR